MSCSAARGRQRSTPKDEAADRAAVEKAQREMDEAAANITFAPTKPAPAESPSRQD